MFPLEENRAKGTQGPSLLFFATSYNLSFFRKKVKLAVSREKKKILLGLARSG